MSTLKLSIHRDPTKISSYYIAGDDYAVVGGQRWLVKKENLPKVWHYSRFTSKPEAQRALEKIEENSEVTLESIKIFYQSQ